MVAQLTLKRLREAREARALSLDDLAQQLGTSRQVLSRYENGKVFPKPETFFRICSILGIAPDFFALPEPSPELAPLFFRHFKSKTTQKQLNAVKRKLLWFRDIVNVAEDFVVFPKVDIPDFSPPSDPRAISDAQIEEAASALRRAWGFGDGIIVEIVKLVESKGCVVASGLVDSSTIDAFSLWTKTGRPLIVANCREVSAAHSRLDIAHELGHLVLHKKIDRRFLEQNPETHKLIERQAFRFGTAFLLPETTFKKSVPYLSLDALLMIKPQWQLSVAAMLHRAEDLQMVSRHVARNLWINLARRGWKRREPLEELIVREEPKLLRNALLTIKQTSDISDFSKRVGLQTKDYERFAQLEENCLAPNPVRDITTVAKG